MILLMLSGGLDSTAALYKLLQDNVNREQIHAHFVEYRTICRRHEAEARAVAQIVTWVRSHVGNFKFSSSVQDYTQLEGCPVDLHMYCFTAAQLVRLSRTKITAVATGLVRTDRAHQWAERRKVAEAIFKACLEDFPDPPPWVFPCYDLSKADELALLPRPLTELTWSCRLPVYIGEQISTCGCCHACQEIQKVSEHA